MVSVLRTVSYDVSVKIEDLTRGVMTYQVVVRNLVKVYWKHLRELKEETGFELKASSHNRIFDTFVKAKGEQETVHHIFAVYDIEISDVPIQKLASHLETGEINDSKGVEWVELDQLTPQNASPLILKLLDPHLKASYFLDWEILSEG